MVEILTKEDLKEFKSELLANISEIFTKPVNQEFITKDETMSLLQCSSRTLDELRKKKAITYVRAGKAFIYETKSIYRYLRKKSIEAY